MPTGDNPSKRDHADDKPERSGLAREIIIGTLVGIVTTLGAAVIMGEWQPFGPSDPQPTAIVERVLITASNTPQPVATATPRTSATPTHPPTATHTPTFTPTPTITPTPTPAPSVQEALTNAAQFAQSGQTNADWLPYIHTFDDGVPVVLVPAGCFLMGNAGEGGQQCIDAPFWIDQYEVSNAQFNRLGGQAANDNPQIDPLLPRERLSWHEAAAFCQRRGARLPTEAEWEYAARGVDGAQYPWGDQFVVTRVNGTGTGDGFAAAAPVDAFHEGASWVGAHQMSGNVWEWTSSLLAAYPYHADDGREVVGAGNAERVLRGGAYLNSIAPLRVTHRVGQRPTQANAGWGVRCVRASG